MPLLLVNMGRTYFRMGRAREALQYYEQYLRIENHPEPQVQGYIEQAKAMLALPGPPPPLAPAPPLIPPMPPVITQTPLTPPVVIAQPPLKPPIVVMSPPPPPPSVDAQPPPPGNNNRASASEERATQRGARLVYGGVASAALGLGFAGLGGASLALDGRCVNDLDPCERQYRGRSAGAAELVTGGILLGAGIGLIALGITWQRKAHRPGVSGQASLHDSARSSLFSAYRAPLLAARLP